VGICCNGAENRTREGNCRWFISGSVATALGGRHFFEGMRRIGPSPVFGEPGHYYNCPDLTVPQPTIHNVSGFKQAVVRPSRGQFLTKHYFVDVPFCVFPGELFRVLICGEEYLVQCPDITRPGERIVVTLEAE
jgi:hypothetical protein